MLAPANVARLFAGLRKQSPTGDLVAFHGALIELQADRSPATVLERPDLAQMPSRQRSTAAYLGLEHIELLRSLPNRRAARKCIQDGVRIAHSYFLTPWHAGSNAH